MSRDVCGICWCPYDGDGKCGCKPAQSEALRLADELDCRGAHPPCWNDRYAAAIMLRQQHATLRQAENDLHMVRGGYGKVLHEKDRLRLDKSLAAIKEILK